VTWRKEGEIMEEKSVALNLAAVEAHFHSEAEKEVAAALELYTDDIVWEAPALNGLDRSYRARRRSPRTTASSGPRCATSSSRFCSASRRSIAWWMTAS